MALTRDNIERKRKSVKARSDKQQKLVRRLVLAGLAGLLLLQGVAVAILTRPGSMMSELPVSDSFVGKVATSDIRAPISFTVADTEATERKRKEAAEAVRSVYDFESDKARRVVRRLKESFELMRKQLEQYKKRTAAEGKQAGEKKSAAVQREEDLLRKAESLDAYMLARKSLFLKSLQAVVSDTDFLVLAKDEFSVRAQQAAATLLERIMGRMIVQSRELLEAERDQGIVVRYLKDSVPQKEITIHSFNKILDVEEARMRVEQLAAIELAELSRPIRRALVHLMVTLVQPNLVFNRDETERRRNAARQAVQPLEIRIEKGAKIIRDGDVIQPWHVRVFQAMQKLTQPRGVALRMLGTILLVVLVLGTLVWFSARSFKRISITIKDLYFLGCVMLIFVVTMKIWYWIFGGIWERFQFFPYDALVWAIPFAAGGMLVRFVLNLEASLVFSIAASFLAGMLMDNSLVVGLYCLVSSLVAMWSVASARQRASLFKAGALTGAVNAGFALAADAFGGTLVSFGTLFDLLFAFSGGILSAMIVTSSVPVFEMLFGYTTDIKLMELANLNHPLLKELIVEAPGSYHHSIIVGSLVEAAAEAINCNPLLAKVMAYYHDIGKIKNPQYFSENQRDGVNPHDKLKPSLSATILKAHVKDGAELARSRKLGKPIIDAILQHHGTSLIKFFYQKAKENETEENPVKEEEFRYPGPRPQTREVALVMLADSVEAAARSVSDPSPARLQGLVQNMINRIFADEQLNESNLTLRDLHEIARAFNKVLGGIYHRRPDYPQAAVKEKEPAEKKKAEGKPQNNRKDEERTEEDLKRLGM